MKVSITITTTSGKFMRSGKNEPGGTAIAENRQETVAKRAQTTESMEHRCPESIGEHISRSQPVSIYPISLFYLSKQHCQQA